MQELFCEKHGLESRKEGLEAAFQVSSDELLAQDKRVVSLPSIDDRKAMINHILKDERKEIERVSREIRGLSHVEKVIRYRYKELESTMSAIRTQKSLIEMELRTGSFYGDENDTSRGSSWGRSPAKPSSPAGDIGEEEIARMMDEATAEPPTEEGGKPNGLLCSICGEPQMVCSSGTYCSNNHGGVDGVEPSEQDSEPVPEAPKPAAAPEPVKSSSDDDFSDFLLGEELDGASFAPKSKRIISKSKSAPSPQPQPVVDNPVANAKAPESAEEDPDIQKFLEGDEYDEFFKNM
jgi:hypothetical protein